MDEDGDECLKDEQEEGREANKERQDEDGQKVPLDRGIVVMAASPTPLQSANLSPFVEFFLPSAKGVFFTG